MKTAITIILAIGLAIGLTWLLAGNSLLMTGFFAPKQEAIRRQTFEQSKAYNQGMVQELQNMQFEYIKATPEQQKLLRSIILHRAADYPSESLPSDLNAFIQELKNEIK